MYRQDILKKATIGISEDVDGNFYTIYDPNKLFDIMIEEVLKVLEINMSSSQINKLKKHWE